MNYLTRLRPIGVAETATSRCLNAELRPKFNGMACAPSGVMTKEELQERSLAFAIAIRPLGEQVMTYANLRRTGQQLIECSASMAANYRAACRARSRAEFVAKLGTVNEECDEAVYWLEYLARTGMVFKNLGELLDEAQQLRAIFGASYGTARANYARSKSPNKSPDPQITKSSKSRDH